MNKRQWLGFLCLQLLLVSILLSCSRTDTGTKNLRAGTYLQFTDALGNSVTLAAKPKRVISAFGSYCEAWLEAGGEIIGVTNDVISQRDFSIDRNTAIIGTVKHPSIEAIIALEPDFVLLSADIPSHLVLSDILTQSGIAHAFFKVEHFEDFLSMLNILTDITGRKDLYRKNGLEVQEQIQSLLAKRTYRVQKPTVLLVRCSALSVKALASDTMINVMLTELGADNLVSRRPSLLSDLGMEAILEENPDFILAIAMGDSDQANQAMKEYFASNPAWKDLKAVQQAHYLFLPKELFQYKPNARWSESYAYLENIIF
ncbi:ABC-type Fe3+-hydroxamate transport system, periplasmic component [Sphaerochaeta pleomorpha str. Grapes]|uniref:ABC-type Fe3+-hydroxamate transport system, periplasmic component n=1 Tax=Sphaerochaeta pleomorpha (strain ATCC BAA-1885 / DSM 22778 / Grapes) TaxID=158190 RepID=G8QR50_SPHPG|nr:ABC transporter substrate-binding protein [Sphaerochaeta pleomorpha]AEV30985.1 ABC-type Fe3+-hydroxamate transport system, periplasmic component [Sphaerochaeta pleomorpha str. Grapes]